MSIAALVAWNNALESKFSLFPDRPKRLVRRYGKSALAARCRKSSWRSSVDLTVRTSA